MLGNEYLGAWILAAALLVALILGFVAASRLEKVSNELRREKRKTKDLMRDIDCLRKDVTHRDEETAWLNEQIGIREKRIEQLHRVVRLLQEKRKNLL